MNSLNDRPHARYVAAVEEVDRRFDEQIAEIRRKQDAYPPQLTPREAADARIAVMEAHLSAVRELRRRYLGGE